MSIALATKGRIGSATAQATRGIIETRRIETVVQLFAEIIRLSSCLDIVKSLRSQLWK
jgi:hypothetical protein